MKNGITNSNMTFFTVSFLFPLTVVLSSYAYLFGEGVFSIPAEEWIFVAIQISIYSIPFLVFLAIGQKSIAVWTMQMALTMGVWIWFVIQVTRSLEDKSGVNIGATWVLLFGPALTAIVSLVVGKVISDYGDRRLR